MDQPGKVATPARGQLNRENEYSPVFVRARETGSAVPSRVGLLILHTRAKYGVYQRDSSRFPYVKVCMYGHRIVAKLRINRARLLILLVIS